MQLPYRFGQYVLTQKIAQGGMAEIFKAKYLGESGFSKDVVIKRLLPVWSDNIEFSKMLVDEAKALVHLSHPNIVQVFELGRDGKTFYISMEYVEGVDLRQFFQKISHEAIPIPMGLVIFLITEVLKALDYAHQRKDEEKKPLRLVHRDISPQNILLSFEGRVQIADFGIAKGRHRSKETTQAQVKGKYAYMSPEQARGEKVDARTDLYAVGILLYELLERKRLFDGINDLATLELVRDGRLPDNALKGFPTCLRWIVLKALQKDPNYRHQNAKEFLEELESFIAQEGCSASATDLKSILSENFPPEIAEEIPWSPETKVSSRPSPVWGWGTAFLFFSLLFGGFGVTLWSYQKEKVPKVPETKEVVPTPESPLKGSITIDAAPHSLRGKLRFGNMEKEFKTPYHLAHLEIAEEETGIVELKAPEGKKLSETFVLSQKTPHYIKTFHFKEAKPAFLKISARPWGEVTIPGVLKKKETPLSQLSLKSGKYQLRVYYPPQDRWLERDVQLASGSKMVCQATFLVHPKLTCR